MVRGAIALSKRLSLSTLVIGIVIVGFGTSLPELLASLYAVVGMNSPELHLGNIMGSNVANILLILGLTALINPIVFPSKPSLKDILFLFLSVVLLGLAFLMTSMYRWYGVCLVIAMTAYILWSLFQKDSQNEEIPEISGPWKFLSFCLPITLISIGVMVFGAKLMVNNAVEIARDWHVSERVIGLTIVAVGTSLPELTASLLSALHKRSDLAIGNIIGSNIFNVLMIPGLTAIIKPFDVQKELRFDFWSMTIVTIIFVIFAIRCRIGRIAGIFFLLLYSAYIFKSFF